MTVNVWRARGRPRPASSTLAAMATSLSRCIEHRGVLMRFDAIAYHGYPGGRPKWHFDRPSKPKPEPVTVPTGLHELAKLATARSVAAGGVDRKAWARSIMARVDAGERVRPICAKFARQALGIHVEEAPL